MSSVTEFGMKTYLLLAQYIITRDGFLGFTWRYGKEELVGILQYAFIFIDFDLPRVQ